MVLRGIFDSEAETNINQELKKAGANFKACCPFHGENTPSCELSKKFTKS